MKLFFVSLVFAVGVSSACAHEFKRTTSAFPVAQESHPWNVDLASIAEQDLGRGKFTPFPGPWCADAVSAWLRRLGLPPLPSRTASSALAYGRQEASPRRNDLVVMNRGHHVGIVVAVMGSRVKIVSGNWSNHVRAAVIGTHGARFVRWA